MEEVGLQPLFEMMTNKANAKHLAEFVAKVKYDLPLREKPGASRNHDGAACQSPRPAQRGEGQGEGSKTRPNKRCRSISSRPRSKPVKARQSETAGLAGQTPSAKTSRPQTPRSPEEAATSPTGQTDSTAPAIRMENETAKNAKNAGNENPALSVLSAFSAVKSAIRNPQSAIESNPVKPGQSETSALTNTPDNAEQPLENAP